MDKRSSAKAKQARDLYEQVIVLSDERVYTKLAELERLYRGNNNNDTIAYIYAEALLNVTFKEVVDASALTVQKLMKLVARHPSNEDIIVCLAAGLADLAEKQPAEAADQTRDQLEMLCQRYPDNDELLAIYADTLIFDDDFNEDLIDYAEDDLLEDIRRTDPRQPRPTGDEAYLRRLSEKTYALEGEELGQHIAELEKLVKASPEHALVCATYAEALLARADEERGDALATTVAAVGRLLEQHPRNLAIAIERGKGFVLQTIREDVVETVIASNNLQELWQRFSYSEALLELYLVGLTNVALKEAEFGLERVLSILHSMHKENPDNADIASGYVRVLCIWAMKHDVVKASKALPKMDKLIDWSSINDDDFGYHSYVRLLYYGMALASIAVRGGSVRQGRTLLEKLCSIACSDPESDTLALLWADTALALLSSYKATPGMWQSLCGELVTLFAERDHTHARLHDHEHTHEPADTAMMLPWEHLRVQLSHWHPHNEIMDIANVQTELCGKSWGFSEEELDTLAKVVEQVRKKYGGNRGLEWRCTAILRLIYVPNA